MINILSFIKGKLHQVFSHIGLLLFDSSTKTARKFSTLHQNETFALLGLDLLDNVTVPFLETLHDISDAINIGVGFFPVLEDERTIKVINISACGELVDGNLKIIKILADSSLNGLLSHGVILRPFNNSSESGSTITDKSMDELVEVWVTDNSADLFGNTLHVLQNLLELSDELTLGWVEGHTFASSQIKAYSGLNTVLLLILFHLIENGLSTILVDTNLGLNHHVVNQSDESSQAVVISLSKLQDSVFELVFLLLEDHRLVFGSLAHFRVF